MQNVTTWGQIPGTLSYKYTKELQLYDIDSVAEDGTIYMTALPPLMYQIDRNFTNIAYDNARKVINYTMTHNYTLINADELDADIES